MKSKQVALILYSIQLNTLNIDWLLSLLLNEGILKGKNKY